MVKKDLKARLQGYKDIRVNGMKFTIRKINPLLDFSSENIPQIFTDFQSRRPETEKKTATIEQSKKTIQDIVNIIEAGVVYPVLEPLNSKEKGLPNALDLMRDFETGYKLYMEILAHSLNMFRGLKKLFFSMKIRHLLYSEWRETIKQNQLSYSFLKEIIQ